MSTAIAVRGSEGNKTTEGSISAIDFETKAVPIYDIHGKKIEGYQRLMRPDTGDTLSIMTDQYKLVQHKDAMLPAVDTLGRDGWTVKASRIQRHGASAYVELIRVDRAVTVVGQRVGERILMRNTYDGTSQLSFQVGGIVLICSNGSVVPGKGGMGFNARHTGDIRERLEFIHSRVRKIEEGIGSRMIESYSQLDKGVPTAIGSEIIKRVLGERKVDRCMRLWRQGIGRNGDQTGWNLYNGITQYLTHEFKGNWGLREKKNEGALGLVTDYIRDGALPTTAEEN